MGKRLASLMVLSCAFVFVGALISTPRAARADGEPSAVYWPTGPVLDQGDSPQCVGYSLETLLEDGPNAYTEQNIPSPYWIYAAAQQRDQWRDKKHSGTSIEAGFAYLQQFGYIDSVTYTHDAQEVADYVLNDGPVEMSTQWDFGMNTPDATGVITPGAFILGYHGWVLDGYDRVNEMFDGQTSRGTSFGNGGHFNISLWSVNVLLNNEDAPANSEAALPHKDAATWLIRQMGRR